MLRRVPGLLSIGLLLTMVGCAHHPRVENPLPGVYRIAVAPFGDKTGGDRGFDLREITAAFADELQRVPTFEVVPLAEVEQVLGDQIVETNQPDRVFALARAVHAQAVLVGDITDYEADYPPRMALHCQLYAMVLGQAELVVDNELPAKPGPEVPPWLSRLEDRLNGEAPPRDRGGRGERTGKDRGPFGRKGRDDDDGKCPHCGGRHGLLGHLLQKGGKCANCGTPITPGAIRPGSSGGATKPTTDQPGGRTVITDPAIRQTSATDIPPESIVGEESGGGSIDPRAGLGTQRADVARSMANVTNVGPSIVRSPNPQPVVEPWVIRHSRVFDGANLGLQYKLEDYHAFRRDARAGEWRGYLHRSDDFNRFCAHQMVFEMLDAAGGRTRSLWKIKANWPWEPWPWK
jgi:hypothetical protein